MPRIGDTWLSVSWTSYPMNTSSAQPFDSPEQNSRRVMNLKGLWTLIKDTFVQWIDDNPFQSARLWLITRFFPWLHFC